MRNETKVINYNEMKTLFLGVDKTKETNLLYEVEVGMNKGKTQTGEKIPNPYLGTTKVVSGNFKLSDYTKRVIVNGGKEGIDMKGMAERLNPGVKTAFLSAELKNAEFTDYVTNLYGTIQGGMNNLTGNFAKGFESAATAEMNKFIVGAAKASPAELQAQYQKMMDQFSQFYQQSQKGKIVGSIQNKLTIVDQSKGGKSFYQNQTKAAYIDDGIE